MIWIALLVGLTFSVCGMFAVKKPPTLHQAEEDDDVTIGWDVHTKTDMSLNHMICFLRSEPLKVFYEMVNGVDVPESSHQQFAGRVQCDKDALREGRIRLHVSGVKTEDSGQYWCDLTLHHDKITRRWVLQPTEHFVLNVTSHGANSDVFFTTPKFTEAAAGEPKPQRPRPESRGRIGLYAGLGLTAAALLVVCACLCLSSVLRVRSSDSSSDSFTDS